MFFFKKKPGKFNRFRGHLLDQYPNESRYAESYRTLRTNLFFSILEKELTSVLVTSAVEKEGKTTTCFNLGYSIAQTERKVLIMDLDLRRRKLSQLHRPGSEKGISDIVTDIFSTRLARGSLADYTLNDLIALTRLQKRTCILDMENSDKKLILYFENGTMTDICLKNRPVHKKPGNHLLSENRHHPAAGTLEKSRRTLGAIRDNMGNNSKNDFADIRSVHAIEALTAAFAMETGRFEFTSYQPGAKKYPDQPVDFKPLLKKFTAVHSG